MKPWRDRIEDTIAFIRNANVNAHGDKRLAVARLLELQYQQGQIGQAISDHTSQGPNRAIRNRAEVQEFRHYRRALILIQSQLLQQQIGQAVAMVGNIPDSGLQVALSTALGMAYFQAQEALVAAYQNLLANPGNWLANNKIHIVRHVGFSGAEPYCFCFDAPTNRYEFLPNANNLLPDRVYHHPVVFHVDVQHFAAIPRAAIPGNHVVGANVMITTQLTGCSMMFQTDAANTNLVAAHIQPGGHRDAGGRRYDLVATLRGAGTGFANPLPGAVGHRVFGAAQAGQVDNYDPDAHPVKHTFCLGVRTHQGWELHCQRHFSGQAADPIVTWRIH